MVGILMPWKLEDVAGGAGGCPKEKGQPWAHHASLSLFAQIAAQKDSENHSEKNNHVT